MIPTTDRYRDQVQAILRIAAGLAFTSHGAQKILGWFGGFGPSGGTAELMSRYGVAGVIELAGGMALVFGLGTRLVAFLASGQMAVAYFLVHSAGGSIWWWANRGELPMLYSFVWLFFAAAGPGAWSLDGMLARRRPAAG
ncbi:MAG: DoxX family protein [Gemmatimonadales bacterium]